MTRAIGWCRRLAVWLAAGAAVAALAAAVVVPRVAGATPYTVLTGSMRPHLPPGTLVVVRPVEDGAITTGDVITYQLESGEPAVVTHRVVEVRADLTGQVEWRTQGDANPGPDRQWVRPEQVRGELWYAVPWLGHAGVQLTSAQRRSAIHVSAGLLGLYAASVFVSGWRASRRRRGLVPRRPAEPAEEMTV